MTGPEQRLWSSHVRPYLERERAARGLFYTKIHGSRFQSGLPDLFVSYIDGDGRTVSSWFEMKAPGKRPTPRQRARADDMWRGGQSVYMVVDLEDLRAWLEGRWAPTTRYASHGAGSEAGPGRRSLYEVRTYSVEV